MSDDKKKEIELQEKTNNGGSNKEETHYLPICLIFGLVFGNLLGILLKNLAVWSSLGICLGIVIGAVLEGHNRKEQ